MLRTSSGSEWGGETGLGAAELLNSSRAPGQDWRLPAVTSSLCSLSWHGLSHPPLTTAPRALPSLPPVPAEQILCPSWRLPRGEVLKHKCSLKIHRACILQHHLIHGAQVGSGL